MKSKRTFMLMIALVIIAALATGCHHRGFRGDKNPERILERLDDHMDDLKLTESQSEQYQEIRERLKNDLAKHIEKQTAFKGEMKELVLEKNGDLKDITAELRPKLKDFPDHVSVFLDYVDELYDLLDEQQKKIVMEEIRDRVDGRFFNRR